MDAMLIRDALMEFFPKGTIPTSSPGLFPQKMGRAGKALGTRLGPHATGRAAILIRRFTAKMKHRPIRTSGDFMNACLFPKCKSKYEQVGIFNTNY